MKNDFKIDFSAFKAALPALNIEPSEKPEPLTPEATEEQADEDRRTVQTFKSIDTVKKMRLMSQANLDAVLDWHMEEGEAWHIISMGDVDSTSFLRHIVKQQKLIYCMVATWVIGKHDGEEMLSWVDRGYVNRFDYYVGELFQQDGRARVARFRNHAKVIAFFGERFSGTIETSANMNTNPRSEQTCITINKDLAIFYKEFFDKINDFDNRYQDWQPWQVP